jgi:hypothetical protein
MSTKLYPPINYSRRVITITQEIINSQFIMLYPPLLQETIDLKIENKEDYIYDYQYQVIKITSSNIEMYPGSEIDCYILSWKRNWGSNCEYLSPIITNDDLGLN